MLERGGIGGGARIGGGAPPTERGGGTAVLKTAASGGGGRGVVGGGGRGADGDTGRTGAVTGSCGDGETGGMFRENAGAEVGVVGVCGVASPGRAGDVILRLVGFLTGLSKTFAISVSN